MSDPTCPPNNQPLLLLPISVISCPHCAFEYSQTCQNLSTSLACPGCGRQFYYIDAFLNHYRRHIKIFIDPIHAIPIAPGYTLGGDIKVIPDELQVTSYGITYNRSPELFFLDNENHPVRDLLLENLYVAAVSISAESFILLSRTFDRTSSTPEQSIRWVSIGEIGNHEKPIWISMLQNSADLILKSEEQASFVMLQIALDFFLDAVIEQSGLTKSDVKAATRRWKISDRRAKIKLLEKCFGLLSKEMIAQLTDLAEQRNRIVHGKIAKPGAHEYTGAEAFSIILKAVIAINDAKYAYLRREGLTLTLTNDS